MLENMFTTKMSMDKKSLQQRFFKIRSTNGKASTLASIIAFFVVIAIVAVSAIYIAAKKNGENEYAMSDEDFAGYVTRPVGAIMAELDYADDEKVVFHYLEGFFIINEQTKELAHKIDLRKLNSAQHTQGDTVLSIAVDKSGKYAYLSSHGTDADKFDKYIIDLNSGEVEIGEMPDGTETIPTVKALLPAGIYPEGRYSNGIVSGDNTYYLLAQEANIGAIQLLTYRGAADSIDTRYIFGEEYINPEARKMKRIQKYLPENCEIIPNSTMKWTIDGETAKELFKALEPNLSPDAAQKILEKFSGDSCDVIRSALDYENHDGMEGLFIFDNATLELMYALTGSDLKTNAIPLVYDFLKKSSLHTEINQTAMVTKDSKLYESIDDEEAVICDIYANDLVYVLYEKAGAYYVQMPPVSIPPQRGFVKKHNISFNTDFSNANYGVVKKGAVIYNSPDENDIYPYEQDGTVTVHKRENGYCNISFPGGVDDKWAKEEDVLYEVIKEN